MAGESDTPGDSKHSQDKDKEKQELELPHEAPRAAQEQPVPISKEPQHCSPNAPDKDNHDDHQGPKKKLLQDPKQSTPESRKRGRSSVKAEAATPATDRPARERKVVERYSASPSSRNAGSKSVSIAKGSGTQLKDIPNVAFKLSKNKADDKLQSLHAVLFGKKAKAHSLKRNIGQFSGFVWSENEEKQRAKVKEKLDKCVKEKLVYFCEVLNIPINKATVKKEELSVKLLEFLESPHSTTDVLLAHKEQKRKRKSMSNKSLSYCEASTEGTEKKQKKRTKVAEKQKTSSAVVEETKSNDNMTHSDAGDDSIEDNEKDRVSKEEMDHIGDKSQEEDDAVEEAETKGKVSDEQKAKEGKEFGKSSKPGNKEPHAKSSKSISTSAKKSLSLKNNNDNADGTSRSPAKSKGSDSKKKTEKDKVKDKRASSKGKSPGKKQSNKSPVKTSVKEKGKSKTNKKAKAGPSREEMQEVVVEILKEVDFNTATLSDILKQLGARFDVDLYSRKAEVKEIITEVINNMSDEEDEEDEDEEDAKNDDAGDADE